MYLEILKNNKTQTDHGLEIRHYFPKVSDPSAPGFFHPSSRPPNLVTPQPNSQIQSDLCLEGEERGQGRERAGEVGRDGTSLFARPTLPERAGAAPAQCALFVPRCSELLVCVCVSFRGAGGGAAGVACPVGS